MTSRLGLRTEPLAHPRRLPSLRHSQPPASAVIWHPRLRPGGELDFGIMVEMSEGSVVAEYLVSGDPGRFITYVAEHRAHVDPGGHTGLRVIDPPGAGRLLRSRGYRSGHAVVAADLGPALAAMAMTWTTTEHGDGWRLVLHGLARPGSPAGVKFADEPRVEIGKRGDAVVARWKVGRFHDTLPDGRLAQPPRVGPIIDSVTLAGAISGARFQVLDQALVAFGIDPPKRTGDAVGDLRAEAGAIVRLYRALAAEVRGIGLPVDIGSVTTPGGLSSVLLAGTGLPALAGRFDLPDHLRAAGAVAYFGGFHQARVLHVPVPAVLADLSAAHPRSAVALGASRYLVAERVEPVDVTDGLQSLLTAPDLDDLAHDPEVWRRFGITLCLVRPKGDVLPAKIDRNLRVAPLDMEGDGLWWHWSDLVSSVLRTGRFLELIEAVHLAPVGMVEGLRPVRLPSGAVLDLGAGDDVFAQLVAERQRIKDDPGIDPTTKARRLAMVKSLATSTYGALARVDRVRVSGKTVDAALRWDGQRVEHRGGYVERPGPWSWLPLAGAVTAGTRLLVTSAAVGIEQAGGTWLHVAADSLAIAATHAGEPQLVPCPGGPVKRGKERFIRALPVHVVRGIVDKADRLTGVRAWKSELGFDAPATALVSGTNRVSFIDDESGRALKITTVQLGGQLLDPSGQGFNADGSYRWATDLHETYVRHRLAGDHGALPTFPAWADRPALFAGQTVTPAALDRLQTACPGSGVRPFAKYVTARSLGRHAVSVDATPTTWGSVDWRTSAGKPMALVDPDTYARALADGRADDLLCAGTVRGYFRTWVSPLTPGLHDVEPIAARLAGAKLIGKESDWLTADADDPIGGGRTGARSEFDPGQDELRRLAGQAGSARLVEVSGVPRSIVFAFLGGRSLRGANLARMTEALAHPERWPKPSGLGYFCQVDHRHRWVGGRPDRCPHCAKAGPVLADAEMAICGACGYGFPRAVPIPCPICERKKATQ